MDGKNGAKSGHSPLVMVPISSNRLLTLAAEMRGASRHCGNGMMGRYCADDKGHWSTGRSEVTQGLDVKLDSGDLSEFR